MKLRFFAIVILFAVVLTSLPAFAATYYVAPTGSDANNGSELKPWQTLTFAANRVSPGETVIVRRGTYREILSINKSNVTFKNYPGETPVIDGQNSLPTGQWAMYGALISIMTNGTSSIVIDGFEVKNSLGRGINVKWANHVSIKNCYVHDIYETGIIIETNSDYTLVENCDVYRHNLNHANENNRPWGAAISITRNSNVTIRGCKAHQGWGEGINTNQSASYTTVEYCTIYDNMSANLYADTVNYATFRYNIIYESNDKTYARATYNNHYGGAIVVANESYDPNYGHGTVVYGNIAVGTVLPLAIEHYNGMPVAGVKVYNNTFVEGQGGKGCIEVNGNSDTVIANNIFLQSTGVIGVLTGSGHTFSNNLWSRDPAIGLRSSHDMIGDPILQKGSGWNNLSPGRVTGTEFGLSDDSPAIGAGTNIGSPYSVLPDCLGSNWSQPNSVLTKQNSALVMGACVHTGSSALQPPSQIKISTGQ
jgi:hypothetical protein